MVQGFKCGKFYSACVKRLPSASELRLSLSSFTVEAWVYIQTFNTDQQHDNAIVGQSPRNGNYRASSCFHLVIRDRRPYFGFYYDDLAGQTVLEPSAWYHLAFVFDLNTLNRSIYVNGSLDSSQVAHGPYKVSNDERLFVSQYAGGRSLNGMISQLRFWGKPLSQEDIRNTMFLVISETCIQERHSSLTYVCSFQNELHNINDELYETIEREDLPVVSIPLLANFPSALPSREFSSFLSSGRYSDISLRLTNDTNVFHVICAHRLILEARSDFFRGLFNSGMQESQQDTIQIAGIDNFDHFGIFLRALYENDVACVPDELVLVVWNYADRFGCSQLFPLLENMLWPKLTLDLASEVIDATSHIGWRGTLKPCCEQLLTFAAKFNVVS
mmetsp:Transcript_493/g.834  ORF Transcript_493/g.834 Transcript_493/m.834 type:complete len:387 (+) Transcript_493:114-1274(+)|eukprot:CAMPEP_0184651982 /NCGR_PEP_ID=MMETSP0308-20130426/9649_1 /TAXON_ID=38269 /ORGANISM="Gloeochaete witrockiana, Strain SAG 46.84" /LENGTH=386 /DNA_ID=CAMNT_0027086573 /DNA_START=40 /DNA_END=1200 /DNA_ORIENTATION=-